MTFSHDFFSHIFFCFFAMNFHTFHDADRGIRGGPVLICEE